MHTIQSSTGITKTLLPQKHIDYFKFCNAERYLDESAPASGMKKRTFISDTLNLLKNAPGRIKCEFFLYQYVVF